MQKNAVNFTEVCKACLMSNQIMITTGESTTGKTVLAHNLGSGYIPVRWKSSQSGSVSWDTKMVVSPDASYMRIKKGMARSATCQHENANPLMSLIFTPTANILDNYNIRKAKSQFKRQ